MGPERIQRSLGTGSSSTSRKTGPLTMRLGNGSGRGDGNSGGQKPEARPSTRHSRAGGSPAVGGLSLGARLRGNDEIAASPSVTPFLPDPPQSVK